MPYKPTIDVFALCFNEEHILPSFIAHYKSMGAHITVYDNNSTDKSVEILTQNGCIVIPYESNGQIRDDIYVNIKNNCWKKSRADWVIVCDIDEFIKVDFDINKYTIINTCGYDMIGPPGSNLGVANPWYSKHIMFRPKFIKEINYKIGGHRCSPIGKVAGSVEIAPLLHYKYISEDYTFQRHLLYQSRLSDINKRNGWGKEYEQAEIDSIKKLYEKLKSECVVVF